MFFNKSVAINSIFLSLVLPVAYKAPELEFKTVLGHYLMKSCLYVFSFVLTLLKVTADLITCIIGKQLGMGRYQKCLHQEATNPKLLIQGLLVSVHQNQTWTFSVT